MRKNNYGEIDPKAGRGLSRNGLSGMWNFLDETSTLPARKGSQGISYIVEPEPETKRQKKDPKAEKKVGAGSSGMWISVDETSTLPARSGARRMSYIS